MSRMSRNKGKVGEREFAALLREHGFSARRGQQFAGGQDSPDVVCSALPVHWEVKRVERANLPAAYAQAVADAPLHGEPVVATRRNKGAWMIYAAAGHYLGMWQQIARLRDELAAASARAKAAEESKH
jgi:Holliday junction resolvase